MRNNLEYIFKDIPVKKGFDEPMSKHTSFGIGGTADMMIFPKKIEDLQKIISLSSEHGIPFFVLGSGTNLLVRDKGIRGVVISLTAGARGVQFKKITNNYVHIVAGGGCKLSRLITFSLENSLGGLEPLSGIPGSVGGALMSNAGTFKGEIKDVVESVRIMDKNGRVKILDAKQIAFGYRRSDFPRHSIILDAELALKKTDKKKIKNKIAEMSRARRKDKQIFLPNAGSIFKNPDKKKAYRIIDEIGMRGERIGNAQVSQKHSNFIVNKGNATAADVIRLINRIRRKAKQNLGISLELEIVIVGERC